MQINEEELKKKLTPEQYRILREKGTEAPFSGQYVNEHSEGTYVLKLFAKIAGRISVTCLTMGPLRRVAKDIVLIPPV